MRYEKDMDIRLTHIGTATLLLEIGSLRLLTDPVFDPAGGHYFFGYGTSSIKLTAPSIRAEDLGKIDAVLLSHDQHEDNLDRAGRALLPHAGKVITTSAGAKRLKGNAIGLRTWQSTTIEASDIKITVTAAPAHHGTLGSHLIVGETTGFILEWTGQKQGALYISGDTVWFHGLREIGQRFKIGTAILHIGGAHFPILGLTRFTLNAREAVRLVHALEPHMVIPIHYEGWKHFRESGAAATKVFEASDIKDYIRWLPLGKSIEVEI
jgi:L-ascorbate metabolism protein UlaG (beta-lactamase superfamily)